MAEPVFSYSDTVVSLTWNESLRWTQDGYYDDFRVSYSTVLNGSRREEYFVTNDTFVALWKLNVEIGPTYTFVVCARKGVQCAAYSTNLYFRGRTLRLLSWNLKLYCRYLYTRPCMINHIWGLKQLWLQVNGHASFHLQRLCWPVRNGEGAKNSKWKYMSPVGFEPTHCQSTTGKSQRLRPLGHEGLMVISGLMSNRIMGYNLKKLLRDNTCQLDYHYGYMCIWTECQTKLSILISL